MIVLKNQVLLGDCLEVLRQIPDETFHSIVMDPPYGLGDAPTVEEIIAYLQGADLKTGDFMGKDWDIPSVLVWRELFRVLKPGGHVLSFGGTRTWDLISLGARAAGFQKRDTFAEEFPGLQWVQSQGMPKSTNISKQIDKKKGAKRKVVGTYQFPPDHPRPNKDMAKWAARQDEAAERRNALSNKSLGGERLVTAPATEEAQQWDGYGTGLKPCWEPILVLRKPLEKKLTLADQIMKTGTGGLNIDACRVKHASKADFEAHKAGVEAIKARGGSMQNSWKNSSDLANANEVTTAGRWPSNVVIVHTPACALVGLKRFKGSGTSKTFHEGYEGESATGFVRGHSHPGNQHGDEDGLETSEHWECVPGCPAAVLDQQSGNRRSTLAGRADPEASHNHPGHDTTTESMWFGKDRTFLGRVYADEGGASRFYPQFDGTPFFYTGKATTKETTLDGELKNDHPTKKPVRLMQWLIRLVTPKGGHVLDPYCGSGSTLHAAIEEDCVFTGIEKDPNFHAISMKRVAIVLENRQDLLTQKSLFALAMGELE